jgi:hypothetical protein
MLRPSRALGAAVLVVTLLAVLTPSAGAAPARVVVYPGFGQEVTLGHETGLGQTSKAFRAFVHHRLVRLWRLDGGTAKCRPAPLVAVKAWTSAGFARVGEGTYAPCPGGGYNQLYVVRHGSWTAPTVLASQEIRSCSLMRWFDIPLPVADKRCYTDVGGLVAYRGYELPADFSTGDYAARVLAQNVQGGGGVGDAWARPAVLDRLMLMRKHGADTFTVTRCFDPDDPTYGSSVGGAPRGCTLEVAKGARVALFVMRLHPAKYGRWQTTRLVRISSSSAAAPR